MKKNRLGFAATLSKIPFPIIALSIAAMLLTMSSAIVFTLMPLYQKKVLGLEVGKIAILESIVEFVALSFRVVSGYFSDFFMQRKPLILLGFGLNSIAKIGLPFSTGVFFIYTFRVFERFGNGIQASPRDAYVGDVAPDDVKGASYGLRQGLGKLGSTVGGIVVFILTAYLTTEAVGLTGETYYYILMVGTGLSFVATLIVALFLKEPKVKQPAEKKRKSLFSMHKFKSLPIKFWHLMGAAFVFNLSHFNESLLSLRGEAINIPDKYLPLIMVFMNLVLFMVSYPIGQMSDRFGRRRFLFLGIVAVVVADLFLAFADAPKFIYAGVFFWGVQMAVTQAMIMTIIADNVNAELRGTAFGVYNLLMGLAYVAGGITYGYLWDTFNVRVPFLTSACVAVFSIAAFHVVLWPNEKEEELYT